MTLTRSKVCLALLGGVMAASTAGCTPASIPWRNPSLPPAQWKHDYYSCRRQAEHESGWREESASGPFRDYDRQQAKALADASLRACMLGLGYLPAEKDPPKPAAP